MHSVFSLLVFPTRGHQARKDGVLEILVSCGWSNYLKGLLPWQITEVWSLLILSLILLSLFDSLCHTPSCLSKIPSNAYVKSLHTDWVVCVGEWLHCLCGRIFPFCIKNTIKTTYIVGSFCNLRERYIFHLNPGTMDHTSRWTEVRKKKKNQWEKGFDSVDTTLLSEISVQATWKQINFRLVG